MARAGLRRYEALPSLALARRQLLSQRAAAISVDSSWLKRNSHRVCWAGVCTGCCCGLLMPTAGLDSNHEGQRLLGYCTGEDETTDGVHAWKAEDQGEYGLGHEAARCYRHRAEGVWPEVVMYANGPNARCVVMVIRATDSDRAVARLRWAPANAYHRLYADTLSTPTIAAAPAWPDGHGNCVL